MNQPMVTTIAILTLFSGLYTTLSRGPWVGAVVLFVVFFLTGSQPRRELVNVGLFGLVGIAVLSVIPAGSRLIKLLPFVGSIDTDTFDYRKRLFDAARIVVLRNPWFGSMDYLNDPGLQQLARSDGFIDIVNTYLQIAFREGLVGPALFGLFFFFLLKRVRETMRSLPKEERELRLLGRVLFSTTAAVLVMIGTVSSASLVPVLYWSLGGIGIAYWRMGKLRAEGGADTS